MVINNGVILCFGAYVYTTGILITLPVTYTNNYAVCCTYESNGTPLTTVFYRNKTLTGFQIYYRSYAYEAGLTEQSYITIGH